MIYFQIYMRSSRYAPQSLQRAVNVKEVRKAAAYIYQGLHGPGKAVVPRTNAYSLSS